MARLEERVAGLEEKVETMDTDAKVHFAELRSFVAERIERLETKVDALAARIDGLTTKTDALAVRIDGLATRTDTLTAKTDGLTAKTDGVAARIEGLDWKVTWLILPALAVIGSTIVWLGVLISARTWL